jgi:hypothetical protein
MTAGAQLIVSFVRMQLLRGIASQPMLIVRQPFSLQNLADYARYLLSQPNARFDLTHLRIFSVM